MSVIKIQISANLCSVQGELTFDTVPSLRKEGDAFIKSVPHPKFDFKEVGFSDSSAISLLLSWYRVAHALDKKVIYLNLPQQVRDLIHLSNLDLFFKDK